MRYRPKLAAVAKRLLARVLELVGKYPRYGYKRIFKLLCREGSVDKSFKRPKK